jgi:hypothetical protein
MNEIYYVDLAHANIDGSRQAAYHADEGWELDRLDNGVLMLMNTQQGRLIEYSPYAWQSVETQNINITEDIND